MADTDDGAIAMPAVPDDGTRGEPKDGDASPTTVSAIPAPHVELAGLLFESPP